MKSKRKKLLAITLIVLITIGVIFRKEIGIKVRQFIFWQSVPKESRATSMKDYPLDILPGEVYPVDLILGDKDNFETFSIYPNQNVHDDSSYYDIYRSTVFQGIVSSNYFLKKKVNIKLLDSNKNLLRSFQVKSISDMNNSGMTEFQGNIDFNDQSLPNGKAFIQIQSRNDETKSILIPININN